MAALRALRAPLSRAIVQPRRLATSPAEPQSTTAAPFVPPPPLPEYQSKWKTTEDVPLSRESFLDLLYGRTPTIREPGWLSRDLCWQHERLLAPKLAPYKHNTGPMLQKAGVAQFEYQAQAAEDFTKRTNEKDEYFREVERWSTLHEDLAAQTGINTYERVIATLRALVPDMDLEVASEGPGRRYFSGIYRALNKSTHLHCDWSPYDSLTEDWIINRVTCQMVFNLYLAPVEGGATTVHDYQWDEAALRLRDPTHYGYRRELVAGRRHVVVQPRPGDLCFFNSRNMHEVAACVNEPVPELGLSYRPRLTLSSFIGLLPSSMTGGRPRLIMWS